MLKHYCTCRFFMCFSCSTRIKKKNDRSIIAFRYQLNSELYTNGKENEVFNLASLIQSLVTRNVRIFMLIVPGIRLDIVSDVLHAIIYKSLNVIKNSFSYENFFIEKKRKNRIHTFFDG